MNGREKCRLVTALRRAAADDSWPIAQALSILADIVEDAPYPTENEFTEWSRRRKSVTEEEAGRAGLGPGG